MGGQPKSRFLLAVALGLVVVGGGGAAAIYASRDSAPAQSAGLVKIEVRAKPVATIRFRNSKLGSTPLVINVPRGTEPLAIEATFTLHELDPITGARRVRHEVRTKTVVPDVEQAVDFAP
jgi:hypothetical protein